MLPLASDDVDARAEARWSAMEDDAEGNLELFVQMTSHVEGFTAPTHFHDFNVALDESMFGPKYIVTEGPPRHAKSETIFHHIVRRMKYRPGSKIAYCTYSGDFAMRKSRRIRKLAARAGVWVGGERQRGDGFDPANTMKFWETPGDGIFVASGRGGAIEGEGFDLIVIDDPFRDPEEAESSTIRDKVWELCTGTLFNRLEPGASIVVTHKRWHVDDLIARIKAQSEDAALDDVALPWEFFTYQALGAKGPLWPERFDRAALKRLETIVGAYYWDAQFQQTPKPRGGRLFDNFARYVKLERFRKFPVLAVDPASTTKTRSNHSAVAILWCWIENKMLHADLERVICVKREVPELVKLLRQVCDIYPGAPLIVETYGGDGRATAQQLKRIDKSLPIVTINSGGDKFLRAQTMAAMASSGRLRVPQREPEKPRKPWVKGFLAECREFTGLGDKADDQVDAVAHACNYAAQHVGGAKARSGRKTSQLAESPF